MRSQGKTLLIILLILLALLLVGVFSAYLVGRGGVDVAPMGSQIVLELDLTAAYPEYEVEGATLRSLFDDRLTLRRLTETLEEAAADDRVVGLLAEVGGSGMGLAAIQELRESLLAFSASGKKTVAFAETLGEFGPGTGGYYLASALDEIYLQPSGDVGLAGMRYEVPFIAGTFDKLGLKGQFGKRHEYKNAVNTYTETAFTEAHREAMTALLESQFSQIVRGLAADRSMDEAAVREIFDRGPYLGPQAEEVGLVDGLAYRDEVRAQWEEEFGEDVEFMEVTEYPAGSLYTGRGSTVALIYGVGAVVRGENRYDPMWGQMMGSTTVAEAFRGAVEDPKVEAILFRIDSPGGSYVASDTIWHEVARAREAGKPVVASFGNVAASGGYFVAMGADHIVAQPGTITGSIGVYSGKVVNREFWKKLGVTWDAVDSSANSAMWSSMEEFGEQGWERMQGSLDRIYEDFVNKAAAGRGMERDELEAIARGRVWTGEAALELGLVDTVGGYPEALAAVRELLELEPDASLRLKQFPRPRSTFEILRDEFGKAAHVTAPDSRTAQLLALTEELTTELRRAGLLTPPYAPLQAPMLPEAP